MGAEFSSALRPDEEPVFPPKGYASHAALSGVVVVTEAAIAEILTQLL